VGDAAQTFEKCLVASLTIDRTDKAGINLDVIQANIVQFADFAELPPKVLYPEVAA
jgi:hypothetical protein